MYWLFVFIQLHSEWIMTFVTFFRYLTESLLIWFEVFKVVSVQVCCFVGCWSMRRRIQVMKMGAVSWNARLVPIHKSTQYTFQLTMISSDLSNFQYYIICQVMQDDMQFKNKCPMITVCYQGALFYGLLWEFVLTYRVIHKSLRDFRTRLRNNQDRHDRKEHINR